MGGKGPGLTKDTIIEIDLVQILFNPGHIQQP
jgi:hypothetical protein